MAVLLSEASRSHSKCVIQSALILLTYHQRHLQDSILVTFKVLHGNAMVYLGVPIIHVADVQSLPALASAGTNSLVVLPFKLSTISSRIFPMAGPEVCNSLWEDITATVTYRQRHITQHFRPCLLTSPINIIYRPILSCSWYCSNFLYLGHLNCS